MVSINISLNMSALRSRVVGSEVKLVLSTSTVSGTPLEGYIGFGTPRIVRHPDTREAWLVFTAWRDTSGVAREIWASPIIDEYELELDLQKAKKIASGADVGVDGLPTVDVLYDDVNGRWIIYSMLYPGQPAIARIVADKEFNLVSADKVSLPLTPNDCGFPVVVNGDGTGLSIVMSGNHAYWAIPDNPYSPTSITVDTSSVAASIYDTITIDVHKLFTVNYGLFMLSEVKGYNNLWHIRLYIGPEKDWMMVGSNDMRGKYILATSLNLVVPHTHDYDIGHVGHPEFSTELKRPVLMWASFRNWNLGGQLAWAHEIWATFVNPYIFSDYRAWLPAIVYAYDSEKGKPFFTAGAKKAILIVKASGAGTITVLESGSPYHIAYDTGNYVKTDFNVGGAGVYKFVIDDPAPYMAVTSDVALDEWGVILTD